MPKSATLAEAALALAGERSIRLERAVRANMERLAMWLANLRGRLRAVVFGVALFDGLFDDDCDLDG